MDAQLQAAYDDAATDLRAAANRDKAPQMQAYMKDQFVFLGLTSPERKALQKPLLRASKIASIDDIIDIAQQCWNQDEREFQYMGCDLLRARSSQLEAPDLDRLREFVSTKSWWDTVDALASRPVGTVVFNYRALASTMDEWIDSDDIWIARTAILHQLFYKEAVDEDRLFSYARTRAGDTEFFIRKAVGWALRSYGRVAPDAVRSFVQAHDAELSGLTKREAMKHL